MSRAEYRKNNSHFVYTNVNPKNCKTASDCVIRAISIATNSPWEQVYSDLFQLGLKMYRMPNEDKVYREYLKSLGWTMCAQPRKPNNTKYRLVEFLKMHKSSEKAIIVRLANHLSVIKKGVILDTWDCGENTVGNYWIKE